MNNIKTPGNLVMLVICVALIPVFILWENRQERLGKPALIPNSLWRNSVFTNVCLMVMFSWAVINVMELAQSGAIQGRPQVSHEDLRAFEDSDSFPIESCLVAETWEMLREQVD